jgi:hypothetical protein
VKTRKPTGLPAFPLILVEGESKAGKSFALAQLGSSPLVDRMFVWDLGDGTMDEYAPLGDYEIVETDGTYSDLLATIREAAAIPAADGKVNVLALDSGTDLWDLLKDWVTVRARRSKAGREALAKDPDAPIRPSTDLWNDAAARWAAVVQAMRRSGCISVITAQGAEVMEMDDAGRPTKNRTWSIQAHKSLPQTVNAWVRVERDPRKATLVGVRRLGMEETAVPLPLENTLHHLVFDVMGGSEGFANLSVVAPRIGLTKREAMNDLYRTVGETHPNLSKDEQMDMVLDVTADVDDDAEIGPSLLEELRGNLPAPEAAA